VRSSLRGGAALKGGAAFVVSLSIIGCSGSPAPSIPAVGSGSQAAVTQPVAAQTTTLAAKRVKPQSARAMAVTPLCPIAGVGPDIATCNSELRTDITANPNPLVWLTTLPGLHPADLRAAYGVTDAAATNGAGQTVAVVVANHNPLLDLDLAVYRFQFGMDPCTRLNGCLKVVMESGTPLNLVPAWSAESDLDVEMVSAICPKCRIIVSEARSAQIGDLAEATGAAVAAGATVVSNSYATTEDPTSLAYDHYYNAPGIPMTAGGGDNGYGASYPASSQYVTAVGGTTLGMSGSSVTSESVWSSSGGGCSAMVAKPSWQTDSACSTRATNDVAVVGDPATGVAVWLTAFGGWNILGGTSVGTPIVASLYALAGNGATSAGPAALYAKPNAFRSVSDGSGSFAGAAGLGAPTGLGAF
jgi:subtilase family serine protease